MKKKIVFILLAAFLLMTSCSVKEETKETLDSAESVSATEEQVSSETETEPDSEPSVPETAQPVTENSAQTAPPTQTEQTQIPSVSTKNSPIHIHEWQFFSRTDATCVANGVRVSVCGCGEKKEEVLLSLPHEYASQGCGNRSRCKHCGALGERFSHHFDKNVCTLCDLSVNSPVFVLNTQLNFDESYSSIVQKLGNPTEIISEGELKSLVYASDLTALTVVQTDSVGLWGVFTLDPDAFFYVNGQIVKMDGFSGKPDTHSDTSYREIGSCRIYGFQDRLGSRKHYGLWLRYKECDYNYMTDPRIVQNYASQSKLSYYYVNGLRAINGLRPLSWSTEAAEVSRAYSQKMAEENFFDHDGLYANRLTSAGIVWRSCGENVSQGYTSAYFVCDAYYNCADHRNNILNSSFTHVGMGFALQTDGVYPISVLGTQTFYS